MSLPHTPRPGHVAHFAIHADDVPRARAFYEQVFGWQFEAWGPPDFFLIDGPDGAPPGLLGALTKRLGKADPTGEGFTTFECTIAVADIDETAKKVAAAGGKVTMKRVAVPGVGTLIKFRDPEANLVVAMQYGLY